VEACYSVIETAFDAEKIGHNMLQRLNASGVKCFLQTTAEKVSSIDRKCAVTLRDRTNTIHDIKADHVFNTTYAALNEIVKRSGFPSIPLKYELTELCLVDVPEDLRRVGITLMCGPFFSVMPFPSTSHHSFTHVRYTPHRTWLDDHLNGAPEAAYASRPKSAWEAIRRDAMRYIPCLADCKYQRSLWDIKTILPRSEKDDSRPILYKRNYTIPGFHCIMGGKIDNIYDVIEAIEADSLLES
jgi:glycine/D-amino acid oxidase-like deaminating enzyme